MRRKLELLLVGCVVAVTCRAQNAAPNPQWERAGQEFQANNFKAAEKDFREITQRDPSNLQAHTYLGHSLFRQQKFAEAIVPYEAARELERRGQKLTETEHRVLVDQLVMSYGISGQLKKAHSLLDEAIASDPAYALNYYNLACTFAEEGDKPKALASLDLAFQHKANVLKGEQVPDPRKDSSFQKYVRDPDFVSLMKKLALP